jgi:mannose-6-phosphate isomerase-like protein (cupin superfamily)
MERTRKTWGEKWNIFENDLCEVSVLYLESHQRCSWHKHIAKWNTFFVVEGSLYIKLEDGMAELLQGQIFTTRPGEMHEFQTHYQKAKVIEIMHVWYDSEDIQRETMGGPLKS